MAPEAGGPISWNFVTLNPRPQRRSSFEDIAHQSLAGPTNQQPTHQRLHPQNHRDFRPIDPRCPADPRTVPFEPRASAVIWPHFPTESSRRPNRPANGGFHLGSDDETGFFCLDGWKVTLENPICYVYRSTITLLVLEVYRFGKKQKTERVFTRQRNSDPKLLLTCV